MWQRDDMVTSGTQNLRKHGIFITVFGTSVSRLSTWGAEIKQICTLVNKNQLRAMSLYNGGSTYRVVDIEL